MANLMMPGNPRYQPKQLQEYFGYDNLFRAVAEVELAALDTLGEIRVIPAEDMILLTSELRSQVMAIPTTRVDEIERTITHHDIRAWVREAQGKLPPQLRRWVHVPMTSYDALDTGRALQFHRAYYQGMKPHLYEVIRIMGEMVEEFADTVQIGRTHGQHALPITVGFWLATILNRIMYNTEEVEDRADELMGKISGAVGAYNAQVGLGIADRCGDHQFEDRVLEKLGLTAGRISTQILPPEPMAYFLHACCLLSASLGQLGRDCRQLMRSEIGEVVESFEEGQVGSSTMAQKRNPINFENLEGTWIKNRNEYGNVLDTLISEHQRDLVGSSVARDFPVMLVNLMSQINTLLRPNKKGVPFLSRVKVNQDACRRNFQYSAHKVLAEPLYIALQMAGYEGDAHEVVNHKATPRAEVTGEQLVEALAKVVELEQDEALSRAMRNIPSEVMDLLHHPEKYTGWAEKKARMMAQTASDFVARR